MRYVGQLVPPSAIWRSIYVLLKSKVGFAVAWLSCKAFLVEGMQVQGEMAVYAGNCGRAECFGQGPARLKIEGRVRLMGRGMDNLMPHLAIIGFADSVTTQQQEKRRYFKAISVLRYKHLSPIPKRLFLQR